MKHPVWWYMDLETLNVYFCSIHSLHVVFQFVLEFWSYKNATTSFFPIVRLPACQYVAQGSLGGFLWHLDSGHSLLKFTDGLRRWIFIKTGHKWQKLYGKCTVIRENTSSWFHKYFSESKTFQLKTVLKNGHHLILLHD